MTADPLVRLRGVAVGYDGVAVVSGVDVDIRAGEFIALLGANGSGKSTLVRAVLGLGQPLAGSIELFGEDAGSFAARWRIGYVPQRTVIAGALPSTVTEVVTSGRLARLGVLRRLRRADTDAVAAAIEAVGLSDLSSHPVAELSGGQQRRVTIARALAASPDLLVLDEPTAGVDAESQARLSETLAELSDGGTTILLIAHEVGPIAHLISRVIVLDQATVAFDGPTTEHQSQRVGHDHGFDGDHFHSHGEPPPRPGTGLMGW